jgi:hypothetical protein
MSPASNYTQQQLSAAFDEIELTLFKDITAEPVPKLLVVAGLQSSGKTYLLENNLLPSERYKNYVRLYLPQYREKHPNYEQLKAQGALYAYEHTEAFIRDIGKKIFEKAFTQKNNIVMESAFDTPGFSAFPPQATTAGYQLETHIVACSKDFAHLSSMKRAFKSVKKGELERFVTMPMLDASLKEAKAAVSALETAAKAVSGSTIQLYERGLGTLKDRVSRGQSTYFKDVNGSLRIAGDVLHYASLFDTITRRRIRELKDQDEMVRDCHGALADAQAATATIPDSLYRDLHGYISKYIDRKI